MPEYYTLTLTSSHIKKTLFKIESHSDKSSIYSVTFLYYWLEHQTLGVHLDHRTAPLGKNILTQSKCVPFRAEQAMGYLTPLWKNFSASCNSYYITMQGSADQAMGYLTPL